MVSFVRRGSRMTAGQRRSMDDHGSRFLIEVERSARATAIPPQPPLDLTQVFRRRADLVVEIGSGQGETLAWAAQRHPEIDYLGFEVFPAGLAATISALVAVEVDNVRLVAGDGFEGLAHLLRPRSCTELWVFFPDPWPKARHHKRRLITPDFIDLAASRLRPGGKLQLATDWPDYAAAMAALLTDRPEFEGLAEGRLVDRPVTKYEARGLAQGRISQDFTWRRRGLADV